MDRRGCGLGTWNGRIILEEDKVEVFGSLNVNFNCYSTLESLRTDFGIHIDTDFLFLFDILERISSMIDFGTHSCLVVFFFDIYFDFMPPCCLEERSSFFD